MSLLPTWHQKKCQQITDKQEEEKRPQWLLRALQGGYRIKPRPINRYAHGTVWSIYCDQCQIWESQDDYGQLRPVWGRHHGGFGGIRAHQAMDPFRNPKYWILRHRKRRLWIKETTFHDARSNPEAIRCLINFDWPQRASLIRQWPLKNN